MKYFIAIDSGGYKTESILFDQTGKVYAYARGRGANAFDIGVAEASDRIRDAAENMKARMPADGEIASVFGSISASYYFPEIEQRLKRQFGKAKVKMDSVVSSVMAAGLGKDDGVCLISGTGSYCCVRKKDNEHRHYIGSSGYMLDTGGSGYVIGQQALIATQRERDGRGPATLLTPILEAEMGETLREHLPVIYAGGRAYISSFAQAVFAARKQGDEVASRIFDDAVNYFAEAMQTAYQIMGHPYRGVLGGGVFLHVPEYTEAVCERAPEGCEMKLLDTPTLYGAALEAMWLAEEKENYDFKSRFLYSFARQAGDNYGW